MEASVFSTEEAIAVVQTAAEIKREVAAETGESNTRMQESLALLAKIAASLAADSQA